MLHRARHARYSSTFARVARKRRAREVGQVGEVGEGLASRTSGAASKCNVGHLARKDCRTIALQPSPHQQAEWSLKAGF